MKIAVYLPNWVGDAVMATPALRALRMQFPAPVEILGVMRPLIADVLDGTPWLDDVLPWDRHASSPVRRPSWVSAELRRRRVNVALLMTNSLSTAWWAWRSGANQRIGFARHFRGWLLTDRLRAPRQRGRFRPRSAIDHYVELAEAAGCRDVSRDLELATAAEDEQSAADVWREFGWFANERPIVFNTGGAYGPAKVWPAEHFAQLGRAIAEQTGRRVLVLCGPNERDEAARIAELAQHPGVQSLASFPSTIGLSKACVRRARLMVSTDSGPRHFAAAFNVPAVSLFGPTDPRWSDNGQAGSVNLSHQVPCGPCSQRVCPVRHHACMRDLSPQRVLETVLAMLARTQSATEPPSMLPISDGSA